MRNVKPKRWFDTIAEERETGSGWPLLPVLAALGGGITAAEGGRDSDIAAQLAEIGVMLLMFGVGLHFSLNDLLAVRKIALPGAVVQMAVASALGIAMAWWLGWSVGSGLIFGLSLSCASTVVLLTYWLSYEYVLSPRSAMEPENAQDALLRGAYHVLGLLAPYLGDEPRAHLLALIEAYQSPATP